MIDEQQHESAMAEFESAAARVRFGSRFLKMRANSDWEALKQMQTREGDEYQIDRDSRRCR